MGRYALLIGISNYNAGLNPLPSAVKDVDALQEVLLNAEIGGFADGNVTVLKDAEKGAIETAIYHLFANRKPDDLLLFYFSGHGVTDDRRDFYFTGLSTSREALPPTAVSSSYVQSQMYNSRSKRQVAILDCCHSGAFPKGMMAKDVGTVDIKLGGEGQAILTAADSSQYAFEQEGFELSLYTHFLVEGLKTGAADRDEDGDVSVDELHLYVEGKVKSVNNSMSPKFFGQKEGHRIVLARAAQDDPKLRFRKEVEKFVKRSNGRISVIAKNLLRGKSRELQIASLEAEEIINQVLLPYVEYAKKIEEYETTLIEMIAEEFPFSEITQEELREYENHLGLREEDIDAIVPRIIKPKLDEYERNLRVKEVQVRESQKQELQQERLDLGNGVNLDLVRIPAGGFMMGMPASERKIALENAKKYNWTGLEEYLDWSTPQHEVKVPAFLLGKYAVTNAQWKAIMGTKPSESSDVKFQGENQPVIKVSWDDAKEFCKKLSEKIKKNVRLPSEAEWEYACRAGTTTAFHFGETITPELVNYDGNYPYGDAPKGEYREKTVDVQSFSPNAWGLYQMHGNVWEWCEDIWHENYNGAPTDGSVWLTGGEQNKRALRGGSWDGNAFICRSAYRSGVNADYSDFNIGFRVVVA
ncbi:MULTISPECIES: caspase, EACC1-associated type [Pseudanabaena]|jgi:formylglycine-generating enzyme required for sulfatase activity|uniref:caspase, EACC1-associated type n=1 Tax=Pseudanabaena TaxID=1152 RepID=UPI00247A16B0|nr:MULTISPECIES: SUMF1/EgtB/PvdO family nonheme iron enzyme [Pseudanabaena]MEA5489063.1 SUMF1/EgtB/PvdO family nonheme iron enzyme [Pseudanabaena sp. CCNP1317]WGS73099.1 SUMF1/EgtB/PvdO family nonheme iron enzyme [Pseudanabaena galeata CCNP1313]